MRIASFFETKPNKIHFSYDSLMCHVPLLHSTIHTSLSNPVQKNVKFQRMWYIAKQKLDVNFAPSVFQTKVFPNRSIHSKWVLDDANRVYAHLSYQLNTSDECARTSVIVLYKWMKMGSRNIFSRWPSSRVEKDYKCWFFFCADSCLWWCVVYICHDVYFYRAIFFFFVFPEIYFESVIVEKRERLNTFRIIRCYAASYYILLCGIVTVMALCVCLFLLNIFFMRDIDNIPFVNFLSSSLFTS